jgi:lipopolysaccharide export system permease protein
MRVLFITANRVGDAVLSTGLLRHLVERHPDARVTVAASRVAASLFEAVPGLERLLPFDKRPFKLHWLGLWGATALRRWDLAVDLRASAIAYLLPARRHLRIRKRDGNQHRVEELAALLGLDPPPAPKVWLAPRHEAAAERLVPAGGPVLAIGPTANWPGKQWRPDRFEELARRLTASGGTLAGARIAIFAAGHERAQTRPVIDALPAERVLDLVGAVDLPGAAACLARCRVFVGNDSGLMHLAAAAGVPTLGLFGPSEDRRYAPWGPHADFVRTDESCAELLERRVPPGGAQETLMDGLSVDTAFAAAEALLRRTG